jgi:succinate-semialdehyde dehydrogenase / glutarate-semialdehyde dehydrogenase
MSKFSSMNPFFNKKIQEYDYLSASELECKLQNAKEAFESMRALPRSEMKDLLTSLAKVIDQNVDEIAKCITTEMGLPIKQAKAQAKKGATHARYYVENLEKFTGPEKVESSAKKSLIYYQPIGTIFQMVPFNFPFCSFLSRPFQ